MTLPTYKRLGLAGLVERTLFTRSPPRMCSGWAPGKCIDARQCYDARRRGGILVPRAADYLPVMTLLEAMNMDKGSLILSPTVGLHENVAVLDFESMFPNIIVNQNVSYETTGREAAEGFITGFTGEALQRRLHFKRMRREIESESAEWRWCEERQSSLKEMLVVIYGYSGCFANRFGSMDAYMKINRIARDSLVKGMGVAAKRGYEILYGNNDSLFLRRAGATREEYEALAEEVTRLTGLPMALDVVYRYLVLLPQKGGDDFGAVNRYYGVTPEGEFNSRGIEFRRGDTPPYVASLQRHLIECLLSQPTAALVRTEGLRTAREAVELAVRDLLTGRVPEEKLRISTTIHRAPAAYTRHCGHVTAAEALAMNHASPKADTLIDYLYVDAGNRNPSRRVKPAVYVGGGIDLNKYEEVARTAAATILSPFDAGGQSRKPVVHHGL